MTSDSSIRQASAGKAIATIVAADDLLELEVLPSEHTARWG